MNRKLVLLLMALTAMGCGVAERVVTNISGMDVSEVKTRNLTCAVVQFGGSVSIDCVPREE